MEGGSGLAAIVKAILMLEKGMIPPNALFEKLNPRIDAEYYDLQVSLPHYSPRYLVIPLTLPDPYSFYSLANRRLEKNFSQLIWGGRDQFTHHSR